MSHFYEKGGLLMKGRHGWFLGLVLGFFICFCGRARAVDDPLYDFYGRHLVAQYYDCDSAALENTKKLNGIMKEATIASGAHLLKDTEYVFEPNGYTMVLLLSESHASIHTYPEHRACFIDFFTCGHNCKAEKFEAVLRSYLKPGRVQSSVQDRK